MVNKNDINSAHRRNLVARLFANICQQMLTLFKAEKIRKLVETFQLINDETAIQFFEGQYKEAQDLINKNDY